MRFCPRVGAIGKFSVFSSRQAHVAFKYPRAVKPMQYRAAQKLLHTRGMGRGNHGDPAVCRRKNGFGVLGVSDLIAEDQLRSKSTRGDLNADLLGVAHQNVKVEIDEALLSQIAESTGGRYFRATDNTKLAEIYSEINKMEKARTTVDSFPIYKELFGRYALMALLALMLELLLNWFVIRRLPC